MLIVLAVFCLGPLFWVVTISLTPERAILNLPVKWIPRTMTLENYRLVLSDPKIHRYIVNSIVVSLTSSALATLLGSLAAYGIARQRFRGKAFLMSLVLFIHLVPGLVSMTALYRMMASLSLLNTLIGLVLVKGAGLSLAIWILKNYFESLPAELEEMARADGCSTLGAFFRVVVPLRFKGILVAGLFLFAQSWKSFFLPLLFISDVGKMTLPLGIFQYVGEHGFEIGRICALSVVSLVPVVLLLFTVNRLGWQSLRPGG